MVNGFLVLRGTWLVLSRPCKKKRLAICNEVVYIQVCSRWHESALLIRSSLNLEQTKCVIVNLADLGGELHCRRAITYFAGLDKNLSKSLVLIEVLGKRGKKLECRRPAF
jgi:hypothetical protein